MSVAQATAKVVFIQKSGTYTAFITCDIGDLFQFYTTNGAGVTTYVPNFTPTNSALLEFKLSNSQVKTENLSIQSITWKFNGVAVSSYPAVFQAVSGHSERLKVIGNIGTISGNTSGILEVEAVVKTPNMDADAPGDRISVSYQVRITQGSADSKIVTIASGATSQYPNNFFISSKDPTSSGYKCILTAKGWSGVSNEMTDAWFYKWYKASPSSPGGWQEITSSDPDHAIGGTHNKTLTVSESGVNTWGMYRVEAYETSSYAGGWVAFDTQEVLDYSDELGVNIGYEPKDATIEDGNASRQAVRITPTIVCRDTGNTPSYALNAGFYFTALDPAGNVLPRLKIAKNMAGTDFAVGSASYLPDPTLTPAPTPVACKAVWVTLEVVQQAGSDVSLIIESENING